MSDTVLKMGLASYPVFFHAACLIIVQELEAILLQHLTGTTLATIYLLSSIKFAPDMHPGLGKVGGEVTIVDTCDAFQCFNTHMHICMPSKCSAFAMSRPTSCCIHIVSESTDCNEDGTKWIPSICSSLISSSHILCSSPATVKMSVAPSLAEMLAVLMGDDNLLSALSLWGDSTEVSVTVIKISKAVEWPVAKNLAEWIKQSGNIINESWTKELKKNWKALFRWCSLLCPGSKAR